MDEASLAAAIRLAQLGNRAGFDQLVDAFASRLLGYLYRMTGSREDAEDLFQEVLLRVVRMIGQYQHDGRFEHWILRIAANLVRDRIRRVARTPKRSHGMGSSEPRGEERGEWLDELEGASETVDAGMTRKEDIDTLNAALAQLTEGEREVILLRHFSQMSFKEISELASIPLGTALARAHRGLSKLRELMAGATADDHVSTDSMKA